MGGQNIEDPFPKTTVGKLPLFSSLFISQSKRHLISLVLEVHYRNRYERACWSLVVVFPFGPLKFHTWAINEDLVCVEKKNFTLEVICSFKEQRKKNVSKGKEIATYSGSKQTQSAVLGGTTCWYKWRRAFSPENYTILATFLREPGCGEVCSSRNLSLHHSDLLPKATWACQF